MVRRKGCRHCVYRYFGCCEFCNILGLGPNSREMIVFIILKNMRRNC